MDIFDESQVEEAKPDLYIVSVGEKENLKTIEVAEELRKLGFFVERDLLGRSFGAQMKFASKMGAKHLLVIGGDELETGSVKVKNMTTGEEVSINLNINEIAEVLKNN